MLELPCYVLVVVVVVVAVVVVVVVLTLTLIHTKESVVTHYCWSPITGDHS